MLFLPDLKPNHRANGVQSRFLRQCKFALRLVKHSLVTVLLPERNPIHAVGRIPAVPANPPLRAIPFPCTLR